jgi:hypothetical protein
VFTKLFKEEGVFVSILVEAVLNHGPQFFPEMEKTKAKREPPNGYRLHLVNLAWKVHCHKSPIVRDMLKSGRNQSLKLVKKWPETVHRLISILSAIDSKMVGELTAEHFTPNNMFFREEDIAKHYEQFLSSSTPVGEMDDSKSVSTSTREGSEKGGPSEKHQSTLESPLGAGNGPQDEKSGTQSLFVPEDEQPPLLPATPPLAAPSR